MASTTNASTPTPGSTSGSTPGSTPGAGTPPANGTAYQQLIKRHRDAELLASSGSILGWDQETMMPAGGLEHRSRQLEQIARLVHGMMVDPRVGDLLAECEADGELNADPISVEAVNIREIRRGYDRATRLPESLVGEIAKTSSLAQHEWAEARAASDFARFRPVLSSMLALLRRKAECLGFPEGGEAWDALADEYEPGSTAKEVEAVFAPLKPRLQTLVSDLMGAAKKPSNRFNEIALPVDDQEKFVRFVAESIGFDFRRGRLDRSVHPFCSGSCCQDVRLTTRFHDTFVNDALGSTIHEAGHGMYEQGLLAEHIGTPMGHAASLGIHESQSRMWENQVGRSLSFWKWCHAKLPRYFGDAVADLSLEETYEGANIVAPGLIRVEADEATYNLHVMIRFELELALMRDELRVDDLPGEWNKRYRDLLGVTVPDDRRGCLQDVHWSMGAIGYFPTYTLGNLYSAQLFEAACAELPGLVDGFAEGDFAPLKHWLNRNVHAHGARYRAGKLCEVVTGEPLGPEPLMRHLDGKLRSLYGI